mgnify:CR=1 FL=1
MSRLRWVWPSKSTGASRISAASRAQPHVAKDGTCKDGTCTEPRLPGLSRAADVTAMARSCHASCIPVPLSQEPPLPPPPLPPPPLPPRPHNAGPGPAPASQPARMGASAAAGTGGGGGRRGRGHDGGQGPGGAGDTRGARCGPGIACRERWRAWSRRPVAPRSPALRCPVACCPASGFAESAAVRLETQLESTGAAPLLAMAAFIQESPQYAKLDKWFGPVARKLLSAVSRAAGAPGPAAANSRGLLLGGGSAGRHALPAAGGLAPESWVRRHAGLQAKERHRHCVQVKQHARAPQRDVCSSGAMGRANHVLDRGETVPVGP